MKSNRKQRIPELKAIEHLDRPFSVCGRRCNIIGFQNGMFPDFGRQRFGEMGGDMDPSDQNRRRFLDKRRAGRRRSRRRVRL